MTVKRVDNFKALALVKMKGDEVRLELSSEGARDIFVSCMRALIDELRSCFAAFDETGMIQINVKYQQKLFERKVGASSAATAQKNDADSSSRSAPI